MNGGAAPAGYMHLTAAVQACGKARYGDEWKGNEPSALYEAEPLPADASRAPPPITPHRIVSARRPMRVVRVAGDPDKYRRMAEELRAQRERRQAAREAWTRMDELAADLVQAFADGTIPARWWLISHHQTAEMPADAWCHQTARMWIRDGVWNPSRDPSRLRVSHPDEATIFAERAGVEAYCARTSGSPPAPARAETALPDWAPSAAQSVTSWATDQRSETAARDLLKSEGVANPSDAAICRKLVGMLAGIGISATEGSISTMRRRARQKAKPNVRP